MHLYPGLRFEFKVTMFEIYNESIRDLFVSVTSASGHARSFAAGVARLALRACSLAHPRS